MDILIGFVAGLALAALLMAVPLIAEAVEQSRSKDGRL